jgi:F1F0 ATPase subunit 2
VGDASALVLSGLAGLGLGALFFAGLWWTTARALSGVHPGLLVLGSVLVRTGALLVGFYLVADGVAARLLACVIGFALANVATRVSTRRSSSALARRSETHHAR